MGKINSIPVKVILASFSADGGEEERLFKRNLLRNVSIRAVDIFCVQLQTNLGELAAELHLPPEAAYSCMYAALADTAESLSYYK